MGFTPELFLSFLNDIYQLGSQMRPAGAKEYKQEDWEESISDALAQTGPGGVRIEAHWEDLPSDFREKIKLEVIMDGDISPSDPPEQDPGDGQKQAAAASSPLTGWCRQAKADTISFEEKNIMLLREMMDLHSRLAQEEDNAKNAQARDSKSNSSAKSKDDPSADVGECPRYSAPPAVKAAPAATPRAKLENLRSQIRDVLEKLKAVHAETAAQMVKTLDAQWEERMEAVRRDAQQYAQNSGQPQEAQPESGSSTGDFFGDLLKRYPPEEVLKAYEQIYGNEPVYGAYTCCTQLPEAFHVCTMEYPLATLDLSAHAENFLYRHYPYLIRRGMLCVPYAVPFDQNFNRLFRYRSSQRRRAVRDACAMGLRLFAMLPPGKVRLTLIDPVGLSESFAMLNQLVSPDERASVLINGRIWSDARQIEEKLRAMTEHISNIHQRCLRGRYRNLCEYNKAAGTHTEPYHVIILMDFPAGMTTTSMELLERIISRGHKCGIFVLAYCSEDLRGRLSGDARRLLESMERQLPIMEFCDPDGSIRFTGHSFLDQNLLWNTVRVPKEAEPAVIAGFRAGLDAAGLTAPAGDADLLSIRAEDCS